jgi:hypothetical protein
MKNEIDLYVVQQNMPEGVGFCVHIFMVTLCNSAVVSLCEELGVSKF